MAEQEVIHPHPFSNHVRVSDAAKFLGLAKRTLGDPSFRKRHQIPTLRIGRAVLFEIDALSRWLAGYQQKRLRGDRD